MKKYIPVAILFLFVGCSGKEFCFGHKRTVKEPKVLSAVFSPDSKKLVVIYTNSVSLYDVTTGNKIKDLFSPLSNEAFEQFMKEKRLKQ